METLAYRPQDFDINKTKPFEPVIPDILDRQTSYGSPFERRETDRTLGAVVDRYITHFDLNWKQEKLPQDWYKLRSLGGKHVGFSMQSQMELLQDAPNEEEVSSWVQKTKQDLIGFKLEYLSDHIVYPCKYERSATDPTRLENSLYGNADMVETASETERNGSVVRGLKEMKSFFLDDETPDGSLAVMTSPIGPSGLKTDDGKDIRYPDSYFFIMQKQGETVHNFTLKTNFTIPECREAIFKLTGKILSPIAPLEEYVETIAKVLPSHDTPPNVSDIVRKLESVRPEYAFKPVGSNEKTAWNDVYADIAQGEALYNFNQKTQDIIEEFESYALEDGHTKEELQKAIAVTILRMSKIFFNEEQKPLPQQGDLSDGLWVEVRRGNPETFGGALDAAADRPGCAGGGSGGGGSTVVQSIAARFGVTEEDEYGSLDFECPDGHSNTRPRGQLIPKCTTCGASVSC